jgi:hypothetical protein
MTFDLSALHKIQIPVTLDECASSVWIPKCLEKPVDLPINNGLKKVSDEDVLHYFTDVLQQNVRIMVINNNYTSYESVCDYCHDFYSIENKYYYCANCYKDMCTLCYDETSEEIALQNGAKNWRLRKDILDICRKQHVVKEKHKNMFPFCDGCSSKLNIIIPFYSNRVKDIDYCVKCCKSDIIDKYDLLKKFVTQADIEEYNNFGNILDWVPLYMEFPEDEEAYMLQCLNPENKFYKRIALACSDDHGRFGFYTCNQTDTLSLLLDEYNKFKRETDDRLKRYAEKKNKSVTELKEDGNQSDESDDSAISDYCDGWGKVYNTPLRQMMTQRNMHTHFG